MSLFLSRDADRSLGTAKHESPWRRKATAAGLHGPGDLAAVIRPTATAQVEQKYSSDLAEVAQQGGRLLQNPANLARVCRAAPFSSGAGDGRIAGKVAYARMTYVEQQEARVRQRIA